MAKTFWTASRFRRRLGRLFAELEGREDELQRRLEDIYQALENGTLTRAPEHHPFDDTCCIPLIDHFVVVCRPNVFTLEYRAVSGRQVAEFNFAEASHFDLLAIQEE
ncbi:MAG TPA: hypothetical protein VEJ47_14245 [Candidatus Eremiobacteraceae bacterium]|nr:hypothetical protein [Candidatus Eremiobacteraceae bacterium]